MLNLNDIQAKLGELNEWELKTDCLERSFFLKTTQEAKEFIIKILDLSEKLNKSPLIFLDRKIAKLSLSSGREGIGEADFELAREIDKLYK
jgi:pterin-4a-carbinolamine dehydratase